MGSESNGPGGGSSGMAGRTGGSFAGGNPGVPKGGRDGGDNRFRQRGRGGGGQFDPDFFGGYLQQILSGDFKLFKDRQRNKNIDKSPTSTPTAFRPGVSMINAVGLPQTTSKTLLT
jgi:hypothetical protein